MMPKVNSTADRPIRVALLGPHFGDYTTQMALGFSDRFDVLVCLAKKAAQAEVTPAWKAALKQKCALIIYDNSSKLEEAAAIMKVLIGLFTFKPDYIIAPEMGHWYYTILIWILSRLYRITLIVHDPVPHTGADAEHASRIAGRIRIERSRASLFVVHGPFCRDLFTSSYAVDPSKVIQIWHGPISRPDDNMIHVVEGSYFLFFGRMQAYKGLDFLLDAIKEFRAKGYSTPIILAGRGPELEKYREEFNSLQGVHIEERFIDAHEVPGLFRDAIALLAPYSEATQSGVVSAAFENGCPVIATSVGGLIDAVQNDENGIQISVGNTSQFVAALVRLHQDSAYVQYLREGAKRSSSEREWSHTADVLDRKFREVL